jgi:hypothetical protein
LEATISRSFTKALIDRDVGSKLHYYPPHELACVVPGFLVPLTPILSPTLRRSFPAIFSHGFFGQKTDLFPGPFRRGHQGPDGLKDYHKKQHVGIRRQKK